MKVKKWKVLLWIIHVLAMLAVCIAVVSGNLNHAQSSNIFLIMHVFVALFWWL